MAKGTAEELGGDRESPRGAFSRRSENDSDDFSASVDHGAAGGAAAHRAANRCDRPFDRTATVGVLANCLARFPDASRCQRVGTVFGISENGGFRTELAPRGDRQGRDVSTDPEEGEIV